MLDFNSKRKSHKYPLKALSSAISLSLLSLSGAALAQQGQQVEEVVVTGSFIRRSEGFSAASPVVQYTARISRLKAR